MQGKFGWIKPLQPIDHPLAAGCQARPPQAESGSFKQCLWSVRPVPEQVAHLCACEGVHHRTKQFPVWSQDAAYAASTAGGPRRRLAVPDRWAACGFPGRVRCTGLPFRCRQGVSYVSSLQAYTDDSGIGAEANPEQSDLRVPFADARSGCPPSRSRAGSIGRRRPTALRPPGQCRRVEKAKRIPPPRVQLTSLLSYLKSEARFGLRIQKWAKALAAATWPPPASLTECCHLPAPARPSANVSSEVRSEEFVSKRRELRGQERFERPTVLLELLDFRRRLRSCDDFSVDTST